MISKAMSHAAMMALFAVSALGCGTSTQTSLNLEVSTTQRDKVSAIDPYSQDVNTVMLAVEKANTQPQPNSREVMTVQDLEGNSVRVDPTQVNVSEVTPQEATVLFAPQTPTGLWLVIINDQLTLVLVLDPAVVAVDTVQFLDIVNITGDIITPTLIVASRIAASTPSSSIQSVDVQIGDPSIAYLDNEFWSEGNKMVWLESEPEGLEYDAYITDIDPNTGQMIPPDGRGTFIDRVAFGVNSIRINGPEWGVSQHGAAVYYAAADQLGIPQLFGPTLFSFKGKSYVVTAVTQDDICNGGTCTTINPRQITSSEIWIASLDGDIQQRISEDTLKARVDPEVYNTGSKLFVSYYTLEAEPLMNELHMIDVALPDFQ